MPTPSAILQPPSPATNRRAVIDIGTNSVKLLVADVAGADVRPLLEDSKQTRLGRGFYETHQLQPEAIAKTAEAVARFAEAARGLGAQSIRVIATSAARDAKNSRDLTEAVERASGLKVEIISGEQEADWAYQGVTSDPALAQHPLLLLDVGGGSTEFILGHGEHKDFRHSFALGSVRLLEKFPVSDPPAPAELPTVRAWLKRFLQAEVRPKIRAELYYEGKFDRVRLVGTGGTTSILARMELQAESFDRERIETVRLSLQRLSEWVERLWSLPLAERRQITGLPPKRADVILTGVAIYEAVMAEFGFTELRVSTRGLRFAAVMDAGA
jgi:exopolyphosphatase/guanosine-5'-triphosphate,3'-diphosphate pyrophosphatase